MSEGITYSISDTVINTVELSMTLLPNYGALFSFQLSARRSDLRQSSNFKKSRQGMGPNMIRYWIADLWANDNGSWALK